MSEFSKVKGPVAVGFLCAMLVFINYFVNVPAISTTVSILRNNTILISAFAMILGAINLIQVNYRYYTTKRSGLWMFGPLYIVLFPVLAYAGLMRLPVYTYFYNNIALPISVAISAFIGFFIAQGMYRTLRVKNYESFLIIASTFLVMLRKVPIGGVIWSGFVPIGNWLLMTFGVGGVRALIIIFGFGVISIGIRTILGYERTQLGVLDEEGD